MKLKMYDFLFLKSNRNFEYELSPSKPFLHSTQSPILRLHYNNDPWSHEQNMKKKVALG